ncbi:MAG: CoA transferase [Actinomycetota bacterium]|nr:CoA transferase [Actinomycetota bacterium]
MGEASTGLLAGLRIIECATFVAGPSGCMALGQMGADVIRVDPIGGAADFNRWPLSSHTGASLYWASLNKGKRSVAVDLRSPEGRELVIGLATAPGSDAGVVVDNNVGRPWLSYEALSSRRADIIQVHIQGHADGRPAVDYTVNPEVGVPWLTGPVEAEGPVNHVLPAWDLLTGMTMTTGLLAALRRRDRTGEGAYLELALADVAQAGVANLGWFAEAAERGEDRPRIGNHLYGSFGVDFATRDGHRVMVVALTDRQWYALRSVTKTEAVFGALESALGIDLTLEADRYIYRETITAILRPWFATRTFEDVRRELEAAQVLWGKFRTMTEAVADFRQDTRPSVLAEVAQPGVGTMVSAKSPLRLDADYGATSHAPALGEHTDQVLAEVLGLNQPELGRLHDAGVIA